MLYVCLAIILGSVFLDQISKWLVIIYLKGEEAFAVIPGVLEFDYLENRGMAFGLLQDQRWIFMVLSVLAIAVMAFYLIKYKPKNKLVVIALSMMIGGGIGNMIDRTFLGYVVDFIDFCAFPDLWRWTFNIADAFACVGAGLLILYLILEFVEEYKNGKKNRADSAEGKN